MATTPYQADLARHQKFLQRVGAHDAKATAQVIRAYDAAVADIEKQVKAQLKALKAVPPDALEAGAISQRLLVLRQRLASIEEVTQASLGVAGQEFSAAIAANAPKAYAQGLAHGYELMTGLVGQIERVNEALLTNTIARLQSGTLANAWLKEHTQTAGAAVRNSLSAGVAMGEGVDDLVRRIPLATKASKARAVTFVRTEILGAARTGNLQTYAANGIGQWRWNAAFDACMLCATRHGQVFPISTPMASHPSCRCSCDPVYPGVGNDPSVSEALFLERVPPAMQLRVLGPSRYSAWSKGQVSFAGLSKEYSHPKYGPGLRATPLSQLGIPKLGKGDIGKLTKSAKAADELADLAKAEADKLAAIKAAKEAAKDPPKAPVVPFEKPKPPDPLPEAPVAAPEPAPVATKVVEPPPAHQQLDAYAKSLGYDPADYTGGALSEADIVKAIANLKASGSKLKPNATNLELAALLADEGVPFPIAADGLVKGFASTGDMLDLVKMYPGYANDLIPALTKTSDTFDSWALVSWLKKEGTNPEVGDALKAIKWIDEWVPGKAGTETIDEYLDLQFVAQSDEMVAAALADDLADIDDVLDVAVDEFDPGALLEELAELKFPELDAVLEKWVDVAAMQGPDALEAAMKATWSAEHISALAKAAPVMKKVSQANDGAPLAWGEVQTKLWARFAEWGADPLKVPLDKMGTGALRIRGAAHWSQALDDLAPTKPSEVKDFVGLMKPPPNVAFAHWTEYAALRASELKDAGAWVKELRELAEELASGKTANTTEELAALAGVKPKPKPEPEMEWTPDPAPAPVYESKWKELKEAFLLSDEEASVVAFVERELKEVVPDNYLALTERFVVSTLDYSRDLTRFVVDDFKVALAKADFTGPSNGLSAIRKVTRESIPATQWSWPVRTPAAVFEFIESRSQELGVDRRLVKMKLMQLRGTKSRRWQSVLDDFDRLYRKDQPRKASASTALGNRRLTRAELDALPDEGSVLEDMKPTAAPGGKPLELDEIQAKPRDTPTPDSIGVVGELTDIGPLPGSSHGGRMVRDAQGTEFIFKPASDAVISEAELAASMLGRRLSMNVPLQAPATVGGKRGLVQAMVPKSQSKGKVIPFDPSFTPNETMANQIVRHHIFDWFIGNHDTHAGNFLIGQEAKLWGVDKGQAWKFLGRDRWDPKWQAPGNHGEKVYRQFWDDVQSGKVKFTDEGWGLIDDIARMPDAEFVGIIKPYFDMLPDGQKQMALALERKRSIRKEWTNFLEERGVRFTPPGEQVDLGMRLPRPETKAGVRGSYINHANLAWQESIRRSREVSAFTGGSYSEYQRAVSRALRDGAEPPRHVQKLQKELLSAPASDEPVTTLRYVANNADHHLGSELGIPELRNATDLRDIGKYIGRAHQTDGFMSTTIKPGGVGLGGGGVGYFDNVGKVGLRLTRPAGSRLTYLDSVSSHSGELEALIEYGIVHRLRRVVVEGGSPSERTRALAKLWPSELGPRPRWLIDGGSGIKSPDGGTGEMRIWLDATEQLLD